MLTRLKVSGFKNLVDTEVQFGPFTCIAGFNGVGKSNIFDAIRFLSALADHPFVKAAEITRGGTELVNLFTAGGDGRMIFECDMVIQRTGFDDFHQAAAASQTFLTYKLDLRLNKEDNDSPHVRLENESLVYIPKGQAKKSLAFPHVPGWRDSVIHTSQRRAAFISTEGDGRDTIVRLSSDRMRDETKLKRGGGRPADFLARTLPRTVLSAAQNAEEFRTAVLARAEMRSWYNLQLEPSALRLPDELQAPSRMDADGRHLPATLFRLANDGDPSRVYAELSNRLAELVEDIHQVHVDRDDVRRVLRLVCADRKGVELPASSLSDGTLRFVALSVLEQDPDTTGLICLEEPENGIHPERMDSIMRILGDMAVNPKDVSDRENPLRQVIVSTHSPVVVAYTAPNDLIFADHRDTSKGSNGPLTGLVLRPSAGTWRDTGEPSAVAHGSVIKFLGSIKPKATQEQESRKTTFKSVENQLDLFGARE